MKTILELTCAAALAMAAFGPSSARAGIENMDQFRNQFNTQTGDGLASVSLDGFQFATRLYASSGNLYDDVSMTPPGAGPAVALTVDATDPTVYFYGSSLYASQSDLDSAYPAGTYTYVANNPGESDTASLAFSTSDYPQSTAYLSGSTYSDLQGMNAGQAFQFNFSSFDTGGNAGASYIFFTIYDSSNNVAFEADLLDPTTTGLTLAAGTLQAGRDYSYELDFSNRDDVPSDGTVFDSTLGFDNRTSGTFFTAVPEPSSLALAATGMLGFVLAKARRRS